MLSAREEIHVKVYSGSRSNDICQGRLASTAEKHPVMRDVRRAQVQTDPLIE